MRKHLFFLFVCVALTMQGQRKNAYFVKHLKFPAGIGIEQKVDMAARLVPTAQQLEWQRLELTAFLHFGINTFTDREWGDGKESPALFNPSQLDAEQWVRELKAAGFQMVILTAKHHDGFCLWPTRTTTHSVASSPWQNGKGDVVKELRTACEAHGMKFGVYLSPWDRHAPSYGDSPRYNDVFVQQLTELLTNYGQVHEVWFDGANAEGPNGRKQIYDWERFYATIRRLQPKAVMAIMGDDVRWVGNEQGLGRTTEWSSTVLTPGIYGRADEQNGRLGIDNMSKDLGSREMLARADELFWYPSEVDVSIRPGWFYHASEDSRVKSVKELVDIYFQSVGYNSVLLLNIPPDCRGLLHETDVARLHEFAAYRRQAFAENLLKHPHRRRKGGSGTVHQLDLKRPAMVNVVMLCEDITKGQRVESFVVEALQNGVWQEVAHGTTVGYKRLLRFPAVTTSHLRLRLLSTRLSANLSEMGVYYAPPVEEVASKAEKSKQPRNDWKVISTQPLVIDLGRTQTLQGLVYTPTGSSAETLPYRYTLSVSEDGQVWHEVIAHGELGNIMHNPQPQTLRWEQPRATRFVRFTATTVAGRPAQVKGEELSPIAEP